MPRYSVHVFGKNAEGVASELKIAFKGWTEDYTGHPFFYVDNHSELTEFKQKIDGMLQDGHEANVRQIDEEDDE